MLERLALAVAMLFAVAAPSAAASSVCRDSYLGDEVPGYAKLASAGPARELCFKDFAVVHSGTSRTPLWAAEHLTAKQVADAEAMSRTDRFHAEPKLPRSERSELSDYRRSGFDRGHMAPSGDMPDAASQRQSFSLANMVPQNHRMNTGVWSDVEETVRAVATTDGEAWVVTGPLFQGRGLQAIGANNVLVPTSVWKAVYDPKRKGAAVYVADNDNSPNCRIVSVATFRTMSGIDPFPALADGTTLLPLTQPKACRQEKP